MYCIVRDSFQLHVCECMCFSKHMFIAPMYARIPVHNMVSVCVMLSAGHVT